MQHTTETTTTCGAQPGGMGTPLLGASCTKKNSIDSDEDIIRDHITAKNAAISGGKKTGKDGRSKSVTYGGSGIEMEEVLPPPPSPPCTCGKDLQLPPTPPPLNGEFKQGKPTCPAKNQGFPCYTSNYV